MNTTTLAFLSCARTIDLGVCCGLGVEFGGGVWRAREGSWGDVAQCL